jgi:hypothetical protein
MAGQMQVLLYPGQTLEHFRATNKNICAKDNKPQTAMHHLLMLQDMAGQMDLLQGQLRVQGALAAKLRAELASVTSDSAVAREVADATEAALRYAFVGE